MNQEDDSPALFDQAAAAVVELGNQLMEQDKDTDPWDVASGLLAGVIQFWLYSHQPCADPFCESCPKLLPPSSGSSCCSMRCATSRRRAITSTHPPTAMPAALDRAHASKRGAKATHA